MGPAGALDADAFTALYERHRADLCRFVMAKTRDRARAEDLVQEVFAKAFAVRHRFDPTRAFWPWLVAIARRECIDSHRRLTYATSRLDEVARSTPFAPSDTTASTVLAGIEAQRLTAEIERLPVRQRVALQLVALDEWSYADVAARLGYSVSMVKGLVVRARRKLRATCVESLGALGGGLHALRRRWLRTASRLQLATPFGAAARDVVAAMSAGAGANVTVAVIAVAVGLLGPTSSSPVPRTDEPGLASSVFIGTAPGAGARPAARHIDHTLVVPSAPAAWAPARAAEEAVNEAAAAILPADAGNDPESVRATSFTVSPNYDEDHTIFLAGGSALGDAPVLSAHLLVSRDGGASWQRLRALGLSPVVQLLFPPAYPRDTRLFALTTKGLQVSSDGGDTFETLVVLPTSNSYAWSGNMTAAALSPRFDDGDPSILLVTGREVWEYRFDTGLVDVVRLGPELAGRDVRSLAFAADDPDGRSLLVAGGVSDPMTAGTYIGRCTLRRSAAPVGAVGSTELSCATQRLPVTGSVLPFRWPPRMDSNVVFLSSWPAQVSLDGGRTFAAARDTPANVSIFDVQSVPSPTGRSAIMAQWSPRRLGGTLTAGPQLALTHDAGRTWTEIFVDVPRFDLAVTAVVTPTGRILAAARQGIACSEDGGRTWARLCPTPERV